MSAQALYRLAADALLIVHALFVVFVVLGLLLVLAGGWRGWRWVRNPWFRLCHLAAIAIVVLQAWLGVLCPLTALEMALLARAGEATYAGAFIAHWVGELLYYEAPAWVFTILYTAFGALVLGSWFLVRPRAFGTRPRDRGA